MSKAVAALGRDMSSEGILKELKWQTKLEKVKEKVMTWTIPAVFGLIKKGSPYVNLLHSAAYFAGNDFVVAEYQNENIGFIGDRMIGVNPHAIVIEDKAWAWEKATVATEAHKLGTFFDNQANRGKLYTKKRGDAEEEVETPMLLHIPAGLVDWLAKERRTPWDLHKKIQKIVADTGITTTPDAVKMSLGWCLKAGQIACGAAGSVTLDPSGVFTQDPNTNEWLKQRLNTTLGVEEQPQQQVVWAPPA